MQTKITIRNEAHSCYIDIEGIIGVAEQSQFESADNRVATFERLRKQVQRIAEVKAENVVVNIRSTGGDVNDALLIYDALRSLDATITTRCYGYTASAATIIAQAADEGNRLLSANTLYLIHRATCAIDGNATSLDSRAELLRKTDERLAELYALHSGKEPAFYAALMAENDGEGRWLSAEEAIEAGLADAIIDEEELSVVEDEPDTADEPDSTKNPDTAEQPAEQEPEMPQNAAQKEKRRRHSESVAGGIIRYLLSRLAYRIEEWINKLREKRKAKKAAQEQSQGDEGSTPETPVTPATSKTKRSKRTKRNKPAEEGGATVPAEPTEPNGEPSEPNVEPSESATTPTIEGGEAEPQSATADQMELPKASVKPQASMLAFRERQKSFSRTAVKLTEDPSTASAGNLANDKAYEEDARAFSMR